MSNAEPETVFKYWKALKAIRSQQQKADIETAGFPYLKNVKDKEKIMQALARAFRLNVSDGDYVKEREIERILRERHGNGKDSG